MVFRLNSEVFEYGIGPEAFHMIPILNLTMSYGIVDTIAWVIACCKCFVSNEEVQVLCPSFPC
jgi:hypothetical protein